MDCETNDSEPRRVESFGHASSANSSLRRRTLSLSVFGTPQQYDDTGSESVSEAGDIGDRALPRNRHSGSGRLRFSDDNVADNSFVGLIEEDAHDLTVSNTVSSVSPLPLQNLSPLPTDAILHPGDKKEETETELPWLLEYISCLIHLAVFGIIGVLSRYKLQEWFGPGVVGATSDRSYMYLDLPSNMVSLSLTHTCTQ